MQGRSLVPLMTGAAQDLNLDAYSESLYPRQPFRVERAASAALGAFQVHRRDRNPSSTTSSAIRVSWTNLYDAAPSARGPDGRASFSGVGARRRAAALARPPSIRKPASGLRRSGTSDRSHKRQGKAGEALPDPKDKIDIFNLMTAAQESATARSDDPDSEPAATGRRQDPNMLDAWVMLGNEYFRQREFQKAVEQLQAGAADQA